MIAFVFSVAFCKISRFSLIIFIGKGIIFFKKSNVKNCNVLFNYRILIIDLIIVYDKFLPINENFLLFIILSRPIDTMFNFNNFNVQCVFF